MKAVIFDLDGTLVNSIDSIAGCANAALKKLGFEGYENDAYKQFVGDGVQKLLERCLQNRGDLEFKYFEELEKEYRHRFKQNCLVAVEPYSGIKDLLVELKNRQVMLAVLTNKPHTEAIHVVENTFGEGCFDYILGQSENIARKPSPEGIKVISKELNINLSDIVYVGDTKTDMMTGKSANVFTIGVLWGFRDKMELEEYHADVIIDKPMDILKYIS